MSQIQSNKILLSFQAGSHKFINGYNCIGNWTISIEPTVYFPDPPPYIEFYETYRLIGWTIEPVSGFPQTYLAYGINNEKASIPSGNYNYVISPPL